MKKVISLILVLCLSLFALCGCHEKEKEVSASEIIDKVLANLDGVESLYLECDTESSMSVMGSKVNSVTRATNKVNIKEKIQYSEITISASGQNMTTECYISENQNGADVYLKVGDNWIKQTAIPMDKVSELGISTDAYKLMNLYFETLKTNCTIKEDKLDGVECYVISGKIDAGEEEILKKNGLGNLLQQLVQSGMTSEQINEIISNVAEFEITAFVDKNTFLPVQIEIDITDVTQSIMAGLAEALGETGEINVEKNIAVSKYSQYNEVGEIIIPEEVLNAQEVQLY